MGALSRARIGAHCCHLLVRSGALSGRDWLFLLWPRKIKLERGVPQLNLDRSTLGVKLGKSNQHAGQGELGSEIGIRIIDNEVDLLNLRDWDAHLGGKQAPPIGEQGEVLVRPHLFGDQICEA